MARVLVGAPVRRKPSILRHFLDGLAELDRFEEGLDFVFVDDNDDPEASAMLRAWDPPVGRGTLLLPQGVEPEQYDSANDYHRWNWRLTYRVAAMRNKLLQMAQDGDYTHVLLVDSDLLLHPGTLQWLLAAEKDIIAEVFWTRFFPKGGWTVPQAWLWGETSMYRIYPDEDAEDLTREEIQRRVREWFDEIRVPGVYQVAGTGACILISRAVLEAGVDYTPVPGIGWWGEDRFFQVRSAVAGFETYVDTHCAPLHIYRDEDLRKVAAFKRSIRKVVPV